MEKYKVHPSPDVWDGRGSPLKDIHEVSDMTDQKIGGLPPLVTADDHEPASRRPSVSNQQKMIGESLQNMNVLEVGMYAAQIKDFAGADQGCCLLMPRSPFMSYWDPIVMLLLVFVAFVTPFEIAFEIKGVFLEIANWCVNVFFTIGKLHQASHACVRCTWPHPHCRRIARCETTDMVLQFFIPYDNGFLLVLSNKKIIRHYLRTWFPIDFVSVVPFDLVGEIVNRGEPRHRRGGCRSGSQGIRAG